MRKRQEGVLLPSRGAVRLLFLPAAVVAEEKSACAGKRGGSVEKASSSNLVQQQSEKSAGGIGGYYRSIRKKRFLLLGLAVLTAFLMLAPVNAGSADLSLGEVCRALLGLGDERSFVVIW